MKPKRVVNKDLVEFVKSLGCICCASSPPNDAHHVTHKGAGGGDTWDNLMPLCRKCHSQWHQQGPGKMIEEYKSVEYWLTKAKRTDVLEKVKR